MRKCFATNFRLVVKMYRCLHCEPQTPDLMVLKLVSPKGRYTWFDPTCSQSDEQQADHGEGPVTEGGHQNHKAGTVRGGGDA